LKKTRVERKGERNSSESIRSGRGLLSGEHKIKGRKGERRATSERRKVEVGGEKNHQESRDYIMGEKGKKEKPIREKT